MQEKGTHKLSKYVVRFSFSALFVVQKKKTLFYEETGSIKPCVTHNRPLGLAHYNHKPRYYSQLEKKNDIAEMDDFRHCHKFIAKRCFRVQQFA